MSIKRKLYCHPYDTEYKGLKVRDIRMYILYNNDKVYLNKSLFGDTKKGVRLLKNDKNNYFVRLGDDVVDVVVDKNELFILNILRYVRAYYGNSYNNILLLKDVINKFSNSLDISKNDVDKLLKINFGIRLKKLDEKIKESKDKIDNANLLDKYKTLTDSVNINTNNNLGLYTISYKDSGVNFQNDLVRYARGLTLDSEGKIIIRGFEKFFNYKQLEQVDSAIMSDKFKQTYSELGFGIKDELEVYEKLDGSLILLSHYKGELVASTTSSIENTYTKIALEFFNEKNNALKGDLLKYLEDNGKTLAFEYISPSNQIVVEYEREDFVLIGCIDNATGKELTVKGLKELSKRFNFTLFKVYKMTLGDLIKEQKENDKIEGYIVRNKYGKRLKFKVDSWFKSSKSISVFYGNKLTKNKVRIILDSYIEDSIDDLLAYESQHTLHSQNKVIGKVLSEINNLEGKADKLYNMFQRGELTRSELGKHKGFEKSLVFSKLKSGKYINEHNKLGVEKYLLGELNK